MTSSETAALDCASDERAREDRRALLAQVHRLNQHILAAPSVSRALVSWCQRLSLSHGRLRAEVIARHSNKFRDALLYYRQVRLWVGGLHVVDAQILYAPDFLTPGMCKQLETSDTPFGLVVAPLCFERQNLATIIPDGLDEITVASRPSGILEHRACLKLRDERTLAVTREIFLSSLLSCA